MPPPDTSPKPMRCGGTAHFDADSGIAYRCDSCLAVIGSMGQPDRCKRLNAAEAICFRGVEGLIHRHQPHPANAPGHWDVIEFTAESKDALRRFVSACEAKFWRPWIVGQDARTLQPAGLLYKPSGATAPWTDDPPLPR